MSKRRFFAGFVVVLAFLQPAGRCLADVSAQLEQGERYADEGQYQQAEAIYKQIVAENPATDAALAAQEKLTILYVRREKLADAEAAYQQLITAFAENPGLPKALDHVADAYREVRLYAKARDVYQQIVAYWPDAEHAVDSQKGVVLTNVLLGDDPNAEAAFAELVTGFSEHKKLARTVDHLADDFRELGKYDRARGVYMYAVEHWPDSKDAIGSQAGVVRTSILLGDDGGAGAALARLLEVYAENEGLAKEIDQLADDYREARKFEKAKSLYKYVVEHWPDSERAAGAQAGSVRCAILMRDDPNAQAELDKLLADYSTSEGMAKTLDQVADEYRRANQHDNARDLYAYVITTYPDSDRLMESLKGLAMTNIAAGDEPNASGAVETMRGEFAGDVSLSKALYEIAARYEGNRKYSEAKAIYQQIIEVDPNSVEPGWAEVQMAKVDVLALVDGAKEDEVESGIDMLIADFNEHPRLAQAVFEIGEKYYSQAFLFENEGLESEGKAYFGKAAATWEKIIRDMPGSDYAAEALLHSGDCLCRLGEYEKGVGYYQKVVDDWPGWKYAWHAQFLVAHTCRDLMNRKLMPADVAKSTIEAGYERVLQDYPNSAGAHDARIWFEHHGQSSEGE